MRIAVMQPYLFAYIGYYQLISAVDLYVSDDSVQYIRKGWINRNRLLSEGEARTFTFSVQKDSHTKKINERVFCRELHTREKSKFLKTLNCYHKAPQFEAVFDLVRRIMAFEDTNVGRFIINSIRMVCRYLDITTRFEIVSQLNYKSNLKKQERTIDICRKLSALEYVNPIGGTEIYSKEAFTKEGMTLHFLKTKEIIYPQFRHAFVPNLSILDVLMFNPKEKVREFLTQYDFV